MFWKESFFSLLKQKLVSMLGHKDIALVAFVAIATSGCFQNASPVTSTKPASGVKQSIAATGYTQTDQCAPFNTNANDYAICQGCRRSLCTVSLDSCTLNFSTLAQCVHDNLSATGGGCPLGFRCGDNQVPDFVSCTCRDATPATNAGPSPGQEDTTVPYLQPGFTIGDRYCPANTTGTGNLYDCYSASGGTSGTYGQYKTASPINVMTDIGYIRWDLGMDISQFSISPAVSKSQPFLGSSGTLAASMSVSYQLKPNTALATTSIKWLDCPEHYSGYDSGGTHYPSTSTYCDPSATGVSVAINNSSKSGVANLKDHPISLNGPSGNYSITETGNTNSPVLATDIGLSKAVHTGLGAAANGAATEYSGMIANVGTYKFSFGGISVKRPVGTSTIATGSVSGQIAVNLNLGYTPVGAVDSTAFSPNVLTGTVSNQQCILGTENADCVVTTVYRTPGGGVAAQHFHPSFFNYTSSISTLSTDIKAASTPKIINDISQFSSATDTTKPARVRVFVRATDGNIYMARGQNGSWSNWLSLGRPWVADNSITTNMSQVSPVYLPYTNAVDSAGAGLNLGATPYSGTLGDGISIASEPVVASYMDTTTTPYTGYIAVFVRVSQLKMDGTIGSYHNAIFYTYAKATTALSSTTTTLDFDSPSKWSRWLPVYDAAGAGGLVRVQGNPLVLINKVGGGPYIYFFGTRNNSRHPPVPRGLNAGNYVDFTSAAGTWFNYSDTLVATSINTATIDARAFSGGSAAVNPSGSLAWAARSATTFNVIGDPIVIAGDWQYTERNAAGSGNIRIYANQLNGADVTTANRAPYLYSRYIRYMDYNLTAGTIVQTSANATCNDSDNNYGLDQGVVSGSAGFIGTPIPINLNTTGAVGGVVANSSYAEPINGTAVARHTYIFGRTLCKSSGNCDTTNPTVAYAAVDSGDTDNCTLNSHFKLFRYGETYDNSTSTTTLRQTIAPQYATSDVVPAYSAALDAAGVDVPIFLFVRDANGKISHGFWESKNSGQGNRRFRFFQSGTYTN